MNPMDPERPELEFESKACPMGCNAGDEIILRGRDRLHHLPGEFTLVRCRACALMRTNPRPTQRSVSFYYPEDYGPHLRAPVRSGTSQGPLPRLKALLYKLFQFDDYRLPPLKPGPLLEVGCASGAFLNQMAGKGWDVWGIELSANAAGRARASGLDVYQGPLESAPDPDRPFHLVVAWMVLEHLYDPLAALVKLRRWTSQGGWLVISVPNAASMEFRLFRSFWYALQLPTHAFHFTPRTLRRVLERGGWKMERLFHQKNLSNLLSSMGYVLQERGLWQSVAGRLIRFPEYPGWERYAVFPFAYLASFLGQTGRMTVWARRQD